MSEKNHKNFIDCLLGFLSDPEGLALDEIRVELKDLGIDSKKVEVITKKMINKKRRKKWN